MSREEHSKRVYFLDARSYDVLGHSDLGEAPLDILDREEWRTVFHHLKAHEVEGVEGRPKGTLLFDGRWRTPCCTLYRAALDYLEEHRNGHRVPRSEESIRDRVEQLVGIMDSHYVPVLVSKQPPMLWDLQKAEVA